MSASESKTLDERTQPLDRPIEHKTLEESRPEPDKSSLEVPNSSEKVSESYGGESKNQDERDKETVNENEDKEEEEEEGECGFCLFMKAGGCRESFVSWEKCIEEAEKSNEDVVEKCFEVTGALKKCMEVHSDYYEPVLRAEKAAESEAIKELEKEAAEIKEAAENKEVLGSD